MGYLEATHPAVATIRAAQVYADQEVRRLDTPGPAPKTVPEFTVFQNAILKPDGTVLVLVEQGYGRRKIDTPIALFFEVGMALLRARLRLNSRGSDKAAGEENVYLRYDIARGRGRLPLNIQANRIIADPPIGRRVRETPGDYHNHLREALRVEENPVEYGPGKARTTRDDAIEALLEAYDSKGAEVQAIIPRHELEALLKSLLMLADRRSAERLALRSAA